MTDAEFGAWRAENVIHETAEHEGEFMVMFPDDNAVVYFRDGRVIETGGDLSRRWRRRPRTHSTGSRP